MTQLRPLLAIALTFFLAACVPVASGPSSPSATEPSPVTVPASTAMVGTVVPIIITSLPPNATPPLTSIPPSPTSIPTLVGGLGPSELKYKILSEFPDFFFCDPDYYPVARDDELSLALQRFPELQANSGEFDAILDHNNLTGLSALSDDQKLLVYREHKKLTAIQLELRDNQYQFQIQVAKAENGSGEVITGLIDSQGRITVQQRTASFATCPICLAEGTLIDTPAGPVAVENLRIGLQVWTVDTAGRRVAAPIVRLGKTITPVNHRVVHLVLEDGRTLWVSPGHPTGDGRTVGQLRAGDYLDRAEILDVELLPYTGSATYDLMPAGGTGLYWANGILMASTMLK